MSTEPDVLVKIDHGKINERLMQRYGLTDMSRIESAHRAIPTALHSPEAKRLFMRLFHITQVHMHYISTISRLNLETTVVEAAELQLRTLLERAVELLDKAIIEHERRLTSNGIKDLAEYLAQALEVRAKVYSAYGKRYLDLIEKLDQLMLIVETMTIDGLIDPTRATDLKAQYKRSVRSVAATTLRVRNRMFNLSRAAADPDAQQPAKPLPAAGQASEPGDGNADAEHADTPDQDQTRGTDTQVQADMYPAGAENDQASGDQLATA